MKKYIILIKIKRTQKIITLRKKIIKKLKEKNQNHKTVNILKEKEEGLYRITIKLKNLVYSVELEHLVVEALAHFQIIKINSELVVQ